MARKQDTRTVKAAGRKKSDKGGDKVEEPAKAKAPSKGKAAKESKTGSGNGKAKSAKNVTSRKPAPPAVRTPVSRVTSPTSGTAKTRPLGGKVQDLSTDAAVSHLPTSANMRLLADDIAGMLDHPDGRAKLAEFLVYLAQHLARS